MNVPERFCPVCKNQNELAATVCRHCGARLEDPFQDPGASTKTTDMPSLGPERSREWPVDMRPPVLAEKSPFMWKVRLILRTSIPKGSLSWVGG
jgi:hypothetical protein